ncbi:MAG TPA: DUF4402 domain-containing protein [Prolixibacteraceae bacterium]|jgi:hypothetical protein
MKNIVLLLCSQLIFLFAAVSEVKAQTSITVVASAEVVEGLATKETSQLNFGRFSPQTQGGKIIMTPDGVRTSEGSVVLAGGTHNAASFFISGQYESTFSIGLPTGPETLTNLENDKTMLVSDWVSSPAQGMGVGKLVGGGMTVKIGASLIVGDMNANPAGMYVGSYAVTFAYN